MRLVAYRQGEDDMMAQVVPGGELQPLAPLEQFYPACEEFTAATASNGRPRVARQSVRLIPFVPPTARVFCVGLNYRSHAEESEMAVPEFPTVFGRWASTLICDGDWIPVPRHEQGLDWEVELAVVIGRRLTDVGEDEAAAGIFGYTAFNDVSARRTQFETAQWTLGKNADRSGPVGPVLVTRDEFPGVDVRLTCRVNDDVVQSALASQMIFSPAAIVAFISRTSTLLPGDLICTGTPEGVGFVRQPPRLLRPGDVLTTEIEGIGRLVNPVVDASHRTSPPFDDDPPAAPQR